jgi:Skp family chaperone for outer membrane proteins
MKKLIFITLLYLVFSLNASADNSYFIDFNKILNGSKSGAQVQKNKQSAYNNLAKSRDDAKKTLIKAVKPIIKKYMEENNIRLVLDKKSVILGDTTLEITDQIITILNKKLPSIKIN